MAAISRRRSRRRSEAPRSGSHGSPWANTGSQCPSPVSCWTVETHRAWSDREGRWRYVAGRSIFSGGIWGYARPGVWRMLNRVSQLRTSFESSRPHHQSLGSNTSGMEADGLATERAEDHRRIARENGERPIRKPSAALAMITREQATFTDRDLARLVHRHSDGKTQFDRVVSAARAWPELAPLGVDGHGGALHLAPHAGHRGAAGAERRGARDRAGPRQPRRGMRNAIYERRCRPDRPADVAFIAACCKVLLDHGLDTLDVIRDRAGRP